MTNDYGVEIQAQPLYVTIPEEEYTELCRIRDEHKNGTKVSIDGRILEAVERLKANAELLAQQNELLKLENARLRKELGEK